MAFEQRYPFSAQNGIPVVTFFHRDWAEQKHSRYQDNPDVSCFGNHCDFCSFIVINDRRICEAFTSNFPFCLNPVTFVSSRCRWQRIIGMKWNDLERKIYAKRSKDRRSESRFVQDKGRDKMASWDMCNWINFAYFLLGNYVKIKSIVRFIL